MRTPDNRESSRKLLKRIDFGRHAMVVRDDAAVSPRPGRVPVWFDHENVTQIVGDVADASA